MLGLKLGRERIFTRFETIRAASTLPSDADFPIEIRNRRAVKRPEGGSSKPWGRLTLTLGERNPVAIGAGTQNMNRTPFVLTLQIFVPEGDGEVAAYDIAAELISPFDYATDGVVDLVNNVRANVHYWTSSFEAVGSPGGGNDVQASGFEQFNATISGLIDDYPTA